MQNSSNDCQFSKRFFKTSPGPVSIDHGTSQDSLLTGAHVLGFLERYEGSSFNGGLYRLYSSEMRRMWTSFIVRAFRKNIVIECFGSDWLGRQFALSKSHLIGNEPGVVMFEPGTFEELEIPATFKSFHDDELIKFTDAALAESAFKEWLSKSSAHPKIDECVGYEVPLFLGGSDGIDNMELVDMKSYWEIIDLMHSQIKDLPEGTSISSVKRA